MRSLTLQCNHYRARQGCRLKGSDKTARQKFIMGLLQCSHHDSVNSSASDGSRSRQSDRTVETSNRSPEGTVSSWESIQALFGNVLSRNWESISAGVLFLRRRHRLHACTHLIVALQGFCFLTFGRHQPAFQRPTIDHGSRYECAQLKDSWVVFVRRALY
jgi:hypothetical protein